MKNISVNRLGFTLIELLVVVLIIGILASIALPNYQQAVAKSRFSTIKPLVAAFAQAEESYYLTNGAYAFDFESLDLEFPGFDRHTSESCPHTNSDEYDGVCHAISNGTNALSTRGIGDKGGRGVIGQVREKNGKYGADYVFYLSNRGNPSEDHHKSGDRVCRAVCVDNSCVWYRVCASETGDKSPKTTTPDGASYSYYTFKY